MGRWKIGQTRRFGITGHCSMKADWNDWRQVELFINLCVQEVRCHGKHKGSLYMHSWSTIEKIFLERQIHTFSQYQLVYQWNILKRKYQEYRSRKKIGYARLDFEEEMKFLFDDIVHSKIDGAKSLSHDSKELSQMNTDVDTKDSSESSKQSLLPFVDQETKTHSSDLTKTTEKSNQRTFIEGLTNENGGCTLSSELKAQVDANDSHESPAKETSLPRDNSARKRGSRDYNDQLETILKTMKRSNEATLEKCNEVLDSMKKLQMEDTLYVAACSIFCESQTHRDQWMILSKKPEEVRIKWILMSAKRLGLG